MRPPISFELSNRIESYSLAISSLWVQYDTIIPQTMTELPTSFKFIQQLEFSDSQNLS